MQFHSLLVSALDGNKWSVLRSGRLTDGKEHVVLLNGLPEDDRVDRNMWEYNKGEL